MFSEFQDFHSVEKLHNEGFSDIPNEKGIYIVLKPKDMEVEFTMSTTAIDIYNGQNLLYDPNGLITKYEKSNKEILYIGKAGSNSSNLKQRIRQLVQYGKLMIINVF